MDPYKSTGAVSGIDTTLTVSGDVIQGFVSSLPANLQGETVTLIGNLHSTFDLSTSVGVVDPGSDVSIHASAAASLYVADNSTVDLTSSQKDDGSPVKLTVTVGGGSNAININKGPSVVFSTGGNDTITSSGGRDQMYGGSGHDSMTGGGRSVMVGGINGGDTMVGGLKANAQDTIGSSGSSLIKVAHGNNLITAGAGDTINAGASHSSIYAADGAATITGGNGSTIYGSGHSSIVGGGKNNTLNLTGSDTLHGGRGANTVNVDDGSQVFVQGGKGHLDVNMSSTSGDDTLFGGSGGLTIHVSTAMGSIVNDTNTLDAAGAHVVQFSSGVTLHVSNVSFDFGNDQHKNV